MRVVGGKVVVVSTPKKYKKIKSKAATLMMIKEYFGTRTRNQKIKNDIHTYKYA